MCRLNDACNEGKTIGYLNPAYISLSQLNSVINRQSKEYRNKTKSQLVSIERENTSDARTAAATYIGNCMVKWRDRNCLVGVLNLR